MSFISQQFGTNDISKEGFDKPEAVFTGATDGVDSLAEEAVKSKSVELLGDTLDCFACNLELPLSPPEPFAADTFTALAATLLLPGIPDPVSGFGSMVDPAIKKTVYFSTNQKAYHGTKT